MKIERAARKVYRTWEQARADVFDHVERFFNPTLRHSTLGYVSPVQFGEAQKSLGRYQWNQQEHKRLRSTLQRYIASCSASFDACMPCAGNAQQIRASSASTWKEGCVA